MKFAESNRLMKEKEQTKKVQTEMFISYVIDYFSLETKVVNDSESTDRIEYIATDKTYKKIEAYNKWAEVYEGTDFEPITIEDVLTFSDKMNDFSRIMSEHDLLPQRIRDEFSGAYGKRYIISFFELETKDTSYDESIQNTEYIPTDASYKIVEAYNKWAKSYESDNFQPITIEDVLTYSDKMSNVYDILSNHSELRTSINAELEGTK